MKRNILTLSLAALIGCAAFVPSAALAGFTRDMKGSTGKGPKVVSRQTQSPLDKRRHQKDAATRNPLLGAPSGVLTIRHEITADRPANHLTRSIENPRGHFIGNVTDYTGMTVVQQAFMGMIDPVSGNVTRIGNPTGAIINGTDYDFQGGALRNGVFYTTAVVNYTDGTMIQWNAVDIETGDVLTPVRFGYDEWGAYAYSMTYNEKEDLFYCLTVNTTLGTSNQLSVIDPNQNFRILSTVALRTSNFVGGIAYCPADEQVYVFDDAFHIGTVEAGSPIITEAGTFINQDCPVQTNTTFQVCYSPLDEAFAAIIQDSYNREIRLGFFDTADWELSHGVKLGGQYGTTFFSAICSTDPYAVNDAPELPAMPQISFDRNELSGTITFTVPAMNYAGIEIPAGTKVAVVAAIDGKEVFNQEVEPGSTQTVTPTLEQGLHEFTISCKLGANEAPVRAVKFYVGNDTPVAPTGLKREGNTISWNAVGAVGVNKGFVDTEAVTYDVYFVKGQSREKLNTEPVKGTSFDFTTPDVQAYVSVVVTATANGLTSADASIGEVVGKALNLPVVMSPSVAESELFQILNPGNDDVRFGFTPIDFDMGQPVFMCRTDFYYGADDWLFTPLMHFADAEHLYNLAFTVANAMYEGDENLDIYVTKEVTTDTSRMNLVNSERHADYSVGTNKSMNFAVPEAGDYFIAFHCTSPAGSSSGVSLYDFAINSMNQLSSDVPADPTKVEIVPAPLGALKATVNITAPTVNAIGKPLDTSKPVSFKIVCGDQEATASAAPGAVASVEIPVAKNGYSVFNITPYNENGEGFVRPYRQYVGLDRPLAPANIQGVPTRDNHSLVLTWEKPGNVGLNGGYVDPDDLEYIIYNVQGVAYYPVATTKDLTYTWTPTYADPANPYLQRYIAGPSATNSVGESVSSLFVGEVLGAPYRLPVNETYSTVNPDQTYFTEAGEYSNSAFNHASTIMAPVFRHNCSVDLSEGGLQFYNTGSRPTKAQLFLPKFSTENETDVDFTLRYLDYAHCPSPMYLYARAEGTNEPTLVATINAEKPVNGEWKDYSVKLPEWLLNKGWVQMIFRAELSTDYDEYGFIDGYTVANNADIDVSVRTISGPSVAFTGENQDYTVTIANGGKERATGTLLIRLFDKDGKQLRYEEKRLPRINPLAEVSTVWELAMMQEYADVSPLKLTATTIVEGDEVAWNDTKEYEINVRKSMVPVVTDLAGKWTDGEKAVQLNWSTPDLKHGNFETFETSPALSRDENLGDWKNYDLDGAEVFGFNGVRWEGDIQPQAWTVIDTNVLTAFKGDPRMGAHSGNKYLLARTPYYDDEDINSEVTQANDWLVSPEVVPGSELSFWYGTVSSDYTEYLELWVSSTDDNVGNSIIQPTPGTEVGATCGSFRYVRTFSKEGADSWENVKVQLPADAKYFALVYRSFDSFGALIDDIEFEQANPANYEVDHYAVWRILDRDWETFSCVDFNVKDLSCLDENISSEHNPTYFVVTYIKTAGDPVSGPRSNFATVWTSGIGGVDAPQAVVGGEGFILVNGYEGQNAKFYSTDGKLLRDVNVNSNLASYGFDAGIYMVTIGKKTYKVIVK